MPHYGGRSDETLLQYPETSAIKVAGTRAELDALLREAQSLSTAIARLAVVKTRIREIVVDEGLIGPTSLGARCERTVAVVRYQAGRISLDQTLLVENGVTPDQIKASKRTGEGYWVVEIDEIKG